MRQDLTQILSWIKSGSRVLDLGCGDGEFLDELEKKSAIQGVGIEINQEDILLAIRRGISVIQQDVDEGLSNFPDLSFDTVVMAHAIQVVHFPDKVLMEMLRIGKEGIVTFPNFGHWRCRIYLALRGRMPVSRFLPYDWYNTPNIHFCTVKDFEKLCAARHITIKSKSMIAGSKLSSFFSSIWPNLFAITAIYRLSA